MSIDSIIRRGGAQVNVSDSSIATVKHPRVTNEDQAEKDLLPTNEEFSQLLKDDTVLYSSANSTNYYRYDRYNRGS